MLEMARASRCRIRIDSSAVPLLEAAMEAASMGLVPGGTHANRKFFGEWTSVGPQVSGETMDLMFDPQTSGGLLLGVRPELADELLAALKVAGVDPAAQIGEVVSADTEGWLEIT
jgi:selenide,water dikinase